jgi:hypothetical protein
VNRPLISPACTTRRTAWSGAWNALWHDRTPWSTRYNFRLLSPLYFFNPNFPFDELIDVRNHYWALDVHESERWCWVADGSLVKTKHDQEQLLPVVCTRPSSCSRARVHKELVVVFYGLESGAIRRQICPEKSLRATYVCVCPDTNTSTSICRAIELSESRSPVGMH